MKNKIKDTACQLFQEKGFHNTSMREIAEELQVSKAALYYHYSNKEELFISIIDEAFQTMNSFFDKIPKDTSFWQLIHLWIQMMVKQRRESPGIRKLIFYLIMGRYKNQINYDMRPHMEKGVESFRKLMDKAIENKEIRNDLPLDFMLKYLFTTVQGMLNEMEERPLLKFDEMKDKELTEALFVITKGALEYK
ncbi:MAG: TetR/AcrR family transcriptional regulator [Candidatus Marinimicrobia bacterium]|nr:TetR/AcrR family transcriptional regulator [Candidatus Neomarinimicrobiota bacterium]